MTLNRNDFKLLSLLCFLNVPPFVPVPCIIYLSIKGIFLLFLLRLFWNALKGFESRLILIRLSNWTYQYKLRREDFCFSILPFRLNKWIASAQGLKTVTIKCISIWEYLGRLHSLVYYVLQKFIFNLEGYNVTCNRIFSWEMKFKALFLQKMPDRSVFMINYPQPALFLFLRCVGSRNWQDKRGHIFQNCLVYCTTPSDFWHRYQIRNVKNR